MALLGAIATDVWLPDAAATLTKGRFTPATRTKTSMMITTEPLMTDRTGGDQERQERETGRSLIGALTVFAETELPVADRATQTEGAWIVKRGKAYEITNTGEWEDDSIGYFEYIAELLDPQPDLTEPEP